MMPLNATLQSRLRQLKPSKTIVSRPSDEEPISEALVIDPRSQVCPAQVVENKLRNILRDSAVRVSHLRLGALCASRRRSCA
jgi:hypothetical protein